MGEDMRGSRVEEGEGRTPHQGSGNGYADFRRARDRFFKELRADCETRHLERALSMPAHEPRHERRSS